MAASGRDHDPMAVYKNIDFLRHSTHLAFDTVAASGTVSPFTGIFRCLGCGREIAAATGTILPGEDHHMHRVEQGSVVWQLVVATS